MGDTDRPGGGHRRAEPHGIESEPGEVEPGKIDAALRSAGAGAVAGMAAGLVWGGIGGRLAMRLIVLTSDDRVRGLTSDDGFKIGQFSPGNTVFLLVATSVLGAIAGLAYGLLRRYLRGPRGLVTLAVAMAVAAAGGGAIVEAEGIDFRLLKPLWLTIGLFVLLPGAWGASVVIMTDRFVDSGSRLLNAPPRAADHSTSRVLSGVAWSILGAIFTLGFIELMSDIAQLT